MIKIKLALLLAPLVLFSQHTDSLYFHKIEKSYQCLGYFMSIGFRLEKESRPLAAKKYKDAAIKIEENIKTLEEKINTDSNKFGSKKVRDFMDENYKYEQTEVLELYKKYDQKCRFLLEDDFLF